MQAADFVPDVVDNLLGIHALLADGLLIDPTMAGQLPTHANRGVELPTDYVLDDHWQLYMDGRLFNIHHDREELHVMTTVLGIDIGTQSVKVVFYDFGACRIASIGSAPLDLCQTDDGACRTAG